MYLVMTLQHNRVTSIKAFNEWFPATKYADEVAIRLNRGLSKEMLDWEEGDYRNVYETNGVAVMIETCEQPQSKLEKIS